MRIRWDVDYADNASRMPSNNELVQLGAFLSIKNCIEYAKSTRKAYNLSFTGTFRLWQLRF